MSEQVKRYHRSFINLMEQSNEGEWVRYENFKELKQQQETASNNAAYYADQALDFEKEVETYKGSTKQLEEACKERTKKLVQANKTILLYRYVMLFMLAVGVIVEVIGAYHG